MTAAALIAVDWGTTSARAYRLDDDGAVIETRSTAFGIQSVRDGAFAATLATILGNWLEQPLPRIACGMIGSRQGWIEAPYLECPAALQSLARQLTTTPD